MGVVGNRERNVTGPEIRLGQVEPALSREHQCKKRSYVWQSTQSQGAAQRRCATGRKTTCAQSRLCVGSLTSAADPAALWALAMEGVAQKSGLVAGPGGYDEREGMPSVSERFHSTTIEHTTCPLCAVCISVHCWHLSSSE